MVTTKNILVISIYQTPLGASDIIAQLIRPLFIGLSLQDVGCETFLQG